MSSAERTSTDRDAIPADSAVQADPSATPTFRGETAAGAHLGPVPARPARGKRVFDVVVSLLALTVISPVLAAAGVAVRVESPGPVLFRQTRVGRHGATFRIHKFRSMRIGGSGPSITVGGDPRITRVGGWLRRTKFDELPQLLDVLTGSMSLVGPRPEVPEYVARWPAMSREVILSVRPGITDPASVRFRNESELLARADDPATYYEMVLLPAKVALYEQYVRTRTFGGDLRILLDTARRLGC